MTIYELYSLCVEECKSGRGETVVCTPGVEPGTLMPASKLDFFSVMARDDHYYVAHGEGAIEVVVVA
jgi:hypothetical protein